MEMFQPKRKSCNIFSDWEFLLTKQVSLSNHSTKSMVLLLLNKLLQYPLHFI